MTTEFSRVYFPLSAPRFSSAGPLQQFREKATNSVSFSSTHVSQDLWSSFRLRASNSTASLVNWPRRSTTGTRAPALACTVKMPMVLPSPRHPSIPCGWGTPWQHGLPALAGVPRSEKRGGRRGPGHLVVRRPAHCGRQLLRWMPLSIILDSVLQYL